MMMMKIMNDLVLFGFSTNPFKAPNLRIDRRFETVFWFRPTVSNIASKTALVLSQEIITKLLSNF